MFSTRLVSLGVLAALAVGWACHGIPKPPPEVLAIEPASVPERVRTPALIRGRNFFSAVQSRLSSTEPPVVDRAFVVRIDEQELAAEDVIALDVETLSIVVPATLLPGPHDVTVITPGGLSGTLAGGLTVEGVPPDPPDAGPPTALVWTPIPSPQLVDVPFPVSVQVVDARGNPTSAPAGGKTSLSVIPGNIPFACTTGCADGGTLGPFVGGRWMGQVKIQDAGVNCVLAATGALSGTSNEFRVRAPLLPASMPPRAKIQVDRAVIHVGETIQFRADESTNSPPSNLDYSWDFTGTASGPPPWTSWNAHPYTSFTYASPGTVMVRLAARNAEELISYDTVRIVVLPAGAPVCVVTRSGNATYDDGAVSCDGPYGTDGMLSLNEVIRIANTSSTKQIITFPPQVPGGGGMFMTGNVTYSLNTPVDIVAPYGIYIDGPELVVDAGTTVISGVSFTGTNRVPVQVGPSGSLLLENAHFFDTNGIRTEGDLTVVGTRMSNCNGSCIGFQGSSARLDISSSQLSASTAIGIDASLCGPTGALTIHGTTFNSLSMGVKVSSVCPRTTIAHSTFWLPSFGGGGTGIQYSGGTGHRLVNTIFAATNTPVSCAGTSFLEKDYNVVPSGFLNGCSMADPNTLRVDPQLKDPSGDDYRLLSTSPARDTGTVTSFDTNGPGPGLYDGPAPDRGAWETW